MATSEDPYATLETPEALDRAMRLIHARRGDDDVYREELKHVFREMGEEARGEDDANVELWIWKCTQLTHALVRVASVTALTASTLSTGLKMSPIDVLKGSDDALRHVDESPDSI